MTVIETRRAVENTRENKEKKIKMYKETEIFMAFS